jgi:NADH-quinone oxidoreductase subunit M
MVIAIIAFTGVAMASVYMLRFFIRAMHNRLKAEKGSYDLSARDGLILVPLVLVILAFAIYPQQALNHSEATVEKVVAVPAADAVAQKGVTP